MVVRKKTLGKRRTLRKRRTLGKRKRRSCRNMKAGFFSPDVLNAQPKIEAACGRIKLKEDLYWKQYEIRNIDHPMLKLLEAVNLSFDQDTALVQYINPTTCQNIQNTVKDELETWFRTYDPLVQDGEDLVRTHAKDNSEISREGRESADKIATKYRVKKYRVLGFTSPRVLEL